MSVSKRRRLSEKSASPVIQPPKNYLPVHLQFFASMGDLRRQEEIAAQSIKRDQKKQTIASKPVPGSKNSWADLKRLDEQSMKAFEKNQKSTQKKQKTKPASASKNSWADLKRLDEQSMKAFEKMQKNQKGKVTTDARKLQNNLTLQEMTTLWKKGMKAEVIKKHPVTKFPASKLNGANIVLNELKQAWIHASSPEERRRIEAQANEIRKKMRAANIPESDILQPNQPYVTMEELKQSVKFDTADRIILGGFTFGAAVAKVDLAVGTGNVKPGNQSILYSKDKAGNISRVVKTVEGTPQAAGGNSNTAKPAQSTQGTGNAYQGVRIINKKYAGQVYKLEGELAAKYPNGVKFNKDGFPDFSPYAKVRVKIDGLKGNTGSDFTAANRAVGLKETPKGYTWHHVEDGRTMMLVPTDLHQAVRHTGGAALIRKGLVP
jgi:hypothetical protein